METSTKVGIGIGVAGVLAYIAYESNVRNKIVSIVNAVVPYKKDTPQNKLVTQGRAFIKKPFYSGCGDLWNHVLVKLDAPDSWINHDVPERGLKWVPSINISKPYGAALKAKAWVEYKKGLFPKKGDLMMIGRDGGETTHVTVVVESDGKGHMKVGQFGAGDNASAWSEGDIGPGGMWGKRHINGWIDAEKIPHRS